MYPYEPNRYGIGNGFQQPQQGWPAAYPSAYWNGYTEEFRARQQPLTFVLVHGSWADASFWDGVAAELRKQGHTVFVPEYPGHGPDPNKDVTHQQIDDAVAKYITDRNLKDIILVGHSFGGTVIQKVAELVPERIKRLVFIDGFVLEDGQSLADQFPPGNMAGFQALIEASGNNTLMLPYPVFRDGFMNLADAQLAQSVYNRISPEPAKPLLEKLDLKKFYTLQIPKSYVYLTEDNVLPQGEGYGFHPHMSSRLGQFRLIKDHGDHMTQFHIDPKRIAQRLYEAGRD